MGTAQENTYNYTEDYNGFTFINTYNQKLDEAMLKRFRRDMHEILKKYESKKK